MSVAFPAPREGVPGRNLAASPKGMEQSEGGDSHSARCAWSFCSGRDRELPSSPGEAVNLVNLREVKVNYGSRPIDDASDTEEDAQPCEFSDVAAERALFVGYSIAMSIIATAGVFTVDAVACRSLSNGSSDPGMCTYLVAGSLPLAAAGVALSVMGAKKLVDAYKERNNT